MKTNEEKITEVMEAFADMERAKAPENFESDLMNRISFSEKKIKWMEYSVAALVLFALLNLLTAWSVSEINTIPTSGDPMETALFDEEIYTTINLTAE